MKKITSKHILSALLTLAALLPGQKAAADSVIQDDYGHSYTLFDSEGYYTATAGSNASGAYTYEYLVDNVIIPYQYYHGFWYTYWMTDDDYGFTTKFIEFHSAAPIVVKGYRLRTGCNTENHRNRRPRSWRLMGKKHADDAWTELAKVTNDTDMRGGSEEPTDYWLTGNTDPYQYFRFEVTAIRGPETIQVSKNVSYNRWRMELSDLQIIGDKYSANTDLEYATIEGLKHYYEYTGSDITPSFTVKNMSGTALTAGTDYIVSYSPGMPNATGTYTLTITGKGSYTGQKTASFKVYKALDGDGSPVQPYIIADAHDWYIFGQYIKENGAGYNEKCYKLADDFDNSIEPITEMIATDESKPFRGTLIGNGRTLHIALKSNSNDGCAPFRYLNGATIQNLTVAGYAATSAKFGASIAVENLGSVSTYITNCYSTVTIASSIKDQYGNATDGTNGGFVAINRGKLTFDGCTFHGRMLGSKAECNGGFVGWNDDNAELTFVQCLFDPVRVSMSKEGSKTFSRNGTNAAPKFSGKTSYYTYIEWGTDQGTRADQVTAHRTAVFGEVKYVTTFFNGTLDFRLPAGALAYTVKNNAGTLEFYRIGPESNVIPKGTAVVIIADKMSDDETMDIALTPLASTTVSVGTNDLLGSDEAVNNSADDKYVLGVSGGTLGFYKYSGGFIPAGKAYMVNQ